MANRWDGFMLGTSEITVSIPIYNEVSVLSLTGDSYPILFSVGGMLLYNKYIYIHCLWMTTLYHTYLVIRMLWCLLA